MREALFLAKYVTGYSSRLVGQNLAITLTGYNIAYFSAGKALSSLCGTCEGNTDIQK